MKKEDTSSFFWTILLILFVRCYLVEPFKIPSGSMIPNLLIGDHLFVSKSEYDIGVPFTNYKVFKVSEPERGDVVVFEYPNFEADSFKKGQYYIKRLIAVPGDEVRIVAGDPIINSSPVEKKQIEITQENSSKIISDFVLNPERTALFEEKLPGAQSTHLFQRELVMSQPSYTNYIRSTIESLYNKDCIEIGKRIHSPMTYPDPKFLNEICPFKVPEGKYFVMGDNRDNSADGREWGLVDRSLLKGRAVLIWLSIDFGIDNLATESFPWRFWKWKIRFNRFGQRII